jgi:hypothetical protein
MDTEGLGSTSRSSNQDTKIFSLALLLSSYFVYNSRGVIDGNAIDDLSLVVNLTKMIHVKSQEDDATDSLHEYFPNFLWVVRDFTLQLEEKGKKISSRQYLENALTQQGGFSEAAAKKNQIRMMISNFFRERDCVTMVRPMVDEDKLRDLNSTPFEDLRPEFQKQISQLKLKLDSTMKPKSLNGKILNGPMLLHLAEAYVTAFNDGGVPTISTAWDRVVSSQCEEALGAAVGIYKNAVGEKIDVLGAKPADGDCSSEPVAFPVSGELLATVHATAAAAALDHLTRESVQDANLLAPFAARLTAACETELSTLTQKNSDTSEVWCQQLVEEVTSPVWERASASLKESTENEGFGLELGLINLKGELEVAIAEYNDRAKGPARDRYC